MRDTCGGAKVPAGIECVGWMHVWTQVAPVGDTACVPESPSRSCSGSRDSGGVNLEEVELVGWVVVHGAANDRQEHKEESSSNEDKRGDGKVWSCDC